MTEQIKSKQRVAEHGEVYTNPREVNAMLDLVKHETERIDSRFLEPACGTGNFLAEVLRRKLAIIQRRYTHKPIRRRNPIAYLVDTVQAAGNLYGIDILEDNAQECRKRLAAMIEPLCKPVAKDAVIKPARFMRVIRFIFERNIVHGDALALKTVGSDPQPIVFSEWSAVEKRKFIRHDYAFHELTPKPRQPRRAPTLFDPNPQDPQQELFSDIDKPVFIPKPIHVYDKTDFLELPDAHN